MSALAEQARARRPAGLRAAVPPRFLTLAWVAVAAALALSFAIDAGVHTQPAERLAPTSWAAARAVGAALLLFGVCGYGPVRLLLPENLRARGALWVLPVGACVSGLALTLLGFAYVPFAVSLPLVLCAGAALAVVAVRRHGPVRLALGEIGWPAYLAGLLTCIALVPFFLAGYPTVSGFGSDAHMATGTAEFLRHNHPTSVNPAEPLDQVPLLWRSKHAIFYNLGAVATLSGLETWEAISPLTVLMLALAAAGLFLLARELLGAGLLGAAVAMSAAGLDRMVLQTGLNPYFNQTWGYFTLPFALVLAWTWVRRRDRGSAALLLLFLVLGAFAYPLALPIPLVGLAVFLAIDVRERRRRGEASGLPDPRRLYRGRRSLLWALPLAALLAVPVVGVAEKAVVAAMLLIDPGESLIGWGGDLRAFIPAHQFFALPSPTLWWLAVAIMGGLAAFALYRAPRALGLGLGAVLVAFLLAAAYFRQRDYGWYFEFKTLAFVAPLLIVCACAGASRLKVVGPLLLALMLVLAQGSARPQVTKPRHALASDIIELREWDDFLRPGASVRLDIPPNEQLWGAYMLAGQPVCSRLPLLGTDYPSVQYSDKADYILLDRGLEDFRGPPADARGQALRRNGEYVLYRARPDAPGVDRCSQRMVQGATTTGL